MFIFPMILTSLILTVSVANPSDVAEWHHLPVIPVHSGKMRAWSFDPKLSASNSYNYEATREVFVVHSGRASGYSLATGKLLWTVPNPMVEGSSQIRSLGRNILFRSGDGHKTWLTLLDSRSGRTMWKREYPFSIRDMHPVGKDLIVSVEVPKPPLGNAYFNHLRVVNGQTGDVKAVLSPTDATANRAALQKAAPETVDQTILFGVNVTRNGVILPAPGPFHYAWIAGEHLITKGTVDDFSMDWGDMAGFTAIRSYRLADLDKPDAPDRWNRRGEGRDYRSRPGQHYTGVLGEHDGKLLVFYERQTVEKNGDIKKVVTPVLVPVGGDMAATPLFAPTIPEMYGGWRTSKGFILWGRDDRSYMLSKGKLVEQPRPAAVATPINETPYGVLYRQETPGGIPIRFYMQPYRLP